MCSYFPAVLRRSTEEKFGAAALFSVRRHRGDRQAIVSILQCKPKAKRSIRPQRNAPSANSEFGAAFGCAVNNQLGIDVEPETSLFFAASRCQWALDSFTGRSGFSLGQLRRADGGDLLLQLPANQLRDFQ